MTHDGQHIMVSHHDGMLPDTSDLSSLAAAAEAHDGMVRHLLALGSGYFVLKCWMLLGSA